MNEISKPETEITRPTHKRTSYSDEQKADAVEYALVHMEDGSSLEQVGIDLGINPGTLWGWLVANPEAENRYEQAKITRARGFIERAIYEMQTNTDFKQAESRARVYMRLAALLNPKEFSDKLHAAQSKQPAAGRMTFTLNFGDGQREQLRELRVIAQPEVGD